MNKTTNYQLNQWDPDDKVQRVDFNTDNAKIDAVLAAIDKKIPKIKGSWYRGDGATSKFLDVGFHPEGVAVFVSSLPGSSAKGIYGGVVGAGYASRVVVGSTESLAIEIKGNGFFVHEALTGNADMDIHCNKKDVIYGYIAIGW